MLFVCLKNYIFSGGNWLIWWWFNIFGEIFGDKLLIVVHALILS